MGGVVCKLVLFAVAPPLPNALSPDAVPNCGIWASPAIETASCRTLVLPVKKIKVAVFGFGRCGFLLLVGVVAARAQKSDDLEVCEFAWFIFPDFPWLAGRALASAVFLCCFGKISLLT